MNMYIYNIHIDETPAQCPSSIIGRQRKLDKVLRYVLTQGKLISIVVAPVLPYFFLHVDDIFNYSVKLIKKTLT